MGEQYVGNCAWETIDRYRFLCMYVYTEENEYRGV